jgi:long-subunit acyl-CoA synthetase (AMP-forming)
VQAGESDLRLRQFSPGLSSRCGCSRWTRSFRVAKANAPGVTEVSEIAVKPAFKTELLAQLAAMRVEAKFKRYEEVKDIVIETNGLNDAGQGFYVENDLMTPSFKLKRPQLKRKYEAALEAIYESMK